MLNLPEYLDQKISEIVVLMLSPAEESRVRVLHEILQKVNSVSKKLNGEGTNLYEDRVLFDTTLEEYLHLGYYLGLDAESKSINPDFERAIINSIKGEVTSDEKRLLKAFERHDYVNVIMGKIDYAENFL